MATNVVHERSDATMAWTNGTGSAVASGAVVDLGWGFGIAAAAIADGEVGSVYTEGVFTIAKATGASTGFAQGRPVGWSEANSNCIRDCTRHIGMCFEAAGDNDTTVNIALNRGRPDKVIVHAATSGEATANLADIDTGWGEAPRVAHADRRSSAGLQGDPLTVTFLSGGDLGKVRVAATDIVAADIITLHVSL